MSERRRLEGKRLGALLALTLAVAHCGALFPRYNTLARPVPPGMSEGGEVSPAPDWVHRLSAVGAVVPRTTRDGRPWDDNGGPDPLVILLRNGTEVFRTSVQRDTQSPRWDAAREFVDVIIENSDVLRVELYDDDGLTRELVGATDLRGVPADARNGGLWNVRLEGGATVELHTVPPPAQLGLGLGWEFHTDYALVLSVERAGPAYGAGLRAGDRILRIANQTVSAMGETGTRQALDRGAYQDVTVSVQRNGATLELELRRDALYPTR